MSTSSLKYQRAYRAKNRGKLNAQARAWRAAHHEKANASSRDYHRTPEGKAKAKEYRDKHRVQLAKYARAWRAANKDRVNTTRKARYLRLREEVLAAYGGKCICCGEKHHHFLSIDHKNGGGKKDRIARGFREGGRNWYKFLLTEHPGHVQILCHNCNMAKGHYGQCPHQAEKGKRP